MDTQATPKARGANGKPKVIRANQFILEDETGKTRGMLAMTEDGPSLRLIDETGNLRAALGVKKDGPVLGLLDENGKVILSQP
jgi:hypothetical protein